jgi:hypothetical protein
MNGILQKTVPLVPTLSSLTVIKRFGGNARKVMNGKQELSIEQDKILAAHIVRGSWPVMTILWQYYTPILQKSGIQQKIVI